MTTYTRRPAPEVNVASVASGYQPVVFLVGSALTMPTRSGGPGVASVTDMVKLIRARIHPDGLKGADAINARFARFVLTVLTTNFDPQPGRYEGGRAARRTSRRMSPARAYCGGM